VGPRGRHGGGGLLSRATIRAEREELLSSRTVTGGSRGRSSACSSATRRCRPSSSSWRRTSGRTGGAFLDGYFPHLLVRRFADKFQTTCCAGRSWPPVVVNYWSTGGVSLLPGSSRGEERLGEAVAAWIEADRRPRRSLREAVLARPAAADEQAALLEIEDASRSRRRCGSTERRAARGRRSRDPPADRPLSAGRLDGPSLRRLPALGRRGPALRDSLVRLSGLALGTACGPRAPSSPASWRVSLGNFISARYGERVLRPLRLYAALETCVALLGLGLVLASGLARLAPLLGGLTETRTGSTPSRPRRLRPDAPAATAMGATLPAHACPDAPRPAIRLGARPPLWLEHPRRRAGAVRGDLLVVRLGLAGTGWWRRR